MDIIILGAVSQGLLWALMALGLYISYKVLNMADLTTEGSFALGGAVAARLIVNGWNPVAAVLMAMLSGVLAGFFTAFLHTKLKIPALLAGILTMTGLYSINLRIMGMANLNIPPELNIAFRLREFFSTSLGLEMYARSLAFLVIGIFVVIVIMVVLWLFFKTELGYALRATGDNAKMICALGVNTNKMKFIGLGIANGIICLSSALVAQFNTVATVDMGIGTIVIGLASIIMGQTLFGSKTILRSLLAVVLGSVLYRLIIAMALQMGLPTQELRLLSSVLLIAVLSLPVVRKELSKIFRKGERHA